MLKVTVDAEKLTTWANGLSVPVGNLIRLATEAESERLIGSIRRECLDHVVVFGERHLRHVLLPYMNYYDETRTQIFGQGCAPIAHGSEGRAYSSPTNPGRAALPQFEFCIPTVGKAVPASAEWLVLLTREFSEPFRICRVFETCMRRISRGFKSGSGRGQECN